MVSVVIIMVIICVGDKVDRTVLFIAKGRLIMRTNWLYNMFMSMIIMDINVASEMSLSLIALDNIPY